MVSPPSPPKHPPSPLARVCRWDTALQLAEEHDYPQVEGLLARYAISLMNKGRRLEAVELYRRANRPTDSALLIGDIAEQVQSPDLTSPDLI